MMKIRTVCAAAFAPVAFFGFSAAALAHPGHESASFLSGFGHPLGGLDHLLAMLAVGLYAAQQAGRARWGLPLGFVLAMLLGAALGAFGVDLPAVEAGIATSVLVLGLLLAFAIRLPLVASLPLVVLFALFHGHAHHAEMGAASLLTYTAGFALATALLHAAGFLLARWLPQNRAGLVARRIAGACMAAIGGVLLGA